jgi:hypothetical protein
MEDKLVTIAQYADYIEAEMAKQMLEDSGIKAVITGENVANVYSGLPALTDLELQVFESQAEEAIDILESQPEIDMELELNQDEDEDEDEEQEQ